MAGVCLARRRGAAHAGLMALAAVVLIVAIACGGKGGPGRQEADAALLTADDVGAGWTSMRPTPIDDAPGGKGFFSVCSYEASSEPRFFAREESSSYFSQSVSSMDPGDIERCMALVAADFATRNVIADPALVPAACPPTSLVLVTSDGSGVRQLRSTIIPGRKGLISTLNLAGMAFDDAWPPIVASACARLAEAEAQIDG